MVMMPTRAPSNLQSVSSDISQRAHVAANAPESMGVNSGFRPNEIHEDDLQVAIHGQPRVFICRGIVIDLREEPENTSSSMNLNSESVSKEIDGNDFQCERA
jgi:hypothetical protein